MADFASLLVVRDDRLGAGAARGAADLQNGLHGSLVGMLRQFGDKLLTLGQNLTGQAHQLSDLQLPASVGAQLACG